MADDAIKRIIAALCDLHSDMNELERILNQYDIPLKDESGNYRSTIEVLNDIADYKERDGK